MAEGEKLGLGAATEAALRALGSAGEEILGRAPHQLALIPTEAAAELAAGDVEAAERRGPGRPPGSRNKRTEEFVDFILGRYRSPLLFLADTYTRPVELLAIELACSREEAFKIQLAAAKELAPFVHQKQPVAVQVDGKGIVTLVIHEGAAMARPIEENGVVTILGEAKVIEEKDGNSNT